MPLGDVSVGVSYLRQYSNRLITEPIPITTPASPDATGKYFSAESNVDMHSLCASASTALSSSVSVGLTVGGNYFRYEEEVFNLKVSGSDRGLFLIGGVDVRPIENLSIGASIRYNWSMEFVPVLNPPLQTLGPVDTTLVRTVAVENPPMEVQLPPALEIGVSWQVLPAWRLLASTEFHNWTTARDNAENRWQVHVGSVVDVNEVLDLRFGFFTLSNATGFNRDILDQKFFTAGLRVKVESLAISLAIMDSHLFRKSLPSGNTWPYVNTFGQTYVSSGVSFVF